MENSTEKPEKDRPTDPRSRYFSPLNVVCLISSLLLSAVLVFEPQLSEFFWKVVSPEETTQFAINLKACKIPIVYDGQSQLPFLWKRNKNNDLSSELFNCSGGEIMSTVLNDDRLVLIEKVKRRKCCLRYITRPSLMESDTYRVSVACHDFQNGTDVSNKEFILVQCTLRNKTVAFEPYATLPTKGRVMNKILHWNSNYQSESKLPYNVAVIMLGSTSKSHAHRSLPRTMSFLEKNKDFVEMNGYHAMTNGSDSSGSNVLHLLSGKTEPTFPTEDGEDSYWDNYTLLWSKFESQKFLTMFSDDSRKMLATGGVEEKKHKAFMSQPTDYYMKPFLEAHYEANEAVSPTKASTKSPCIGKKTMTEYLLQHLNKFHKKFDMVPTFSLSYFSWPQAQYGLESLSTMDHVYLEFFINFLSNPKILSRTAVVILSDHGFINHPYFDTEHGSIEKLNPLLMIRLPNHLVQRHPAFLQNLKHNAHRIVTPIDVHRTISIFSNLGIRKNDDLSNDDNGNESGNSTQDNQTFSADSKNDTSPEKNDEEDRSGENADGMETFGRNLFTSKISHTRGCSEVSIPDTLCLCDRPIPQNFNGRTIVGKDGSPEKYWSYVVDDS